MHIDTKMSNKGWGRWCQCLASTCTHTGVRTVLGDHDTWQKGVYSEGHCAVHDQAVPVNTTSTCIPTPRPCHLPVHWSWAIALMSGWVSSTAHNPKLWGRQGQSDPHGSTARSAWKSTGFSERYCVQSGGKPLKNGTQGCPLDSVHKCMCVLHTHKYTCICIHAYEKGLKEYLLLNGVRIMSFQHTWLFPRVKISIEASPYSHLFLDCQDSCSQVWCAVTVLQHSPVPPPSTQQ